MYNLTGDIHGYASELKALLAKMDYQVTDGIWQHPVRKVIFLGYFVDRGPEHIESVNIARTKVESGSALAVMGNHEYNAVAWATSDPQDPEQFQRLLGSDGAKSVFLGQYWLYSETVKLIKSMILYE
ncbi:metallophosphoesterase [Marinobacter gelidimuriae]|uniref:metallophosphoesterase n=1 Tax=Marinobacter gelidimuriae TaxID=2739064 RepID=UPI00036CDEB1|nr:metallophosphoesterase [Marinobacter gelidimuriae]